MASSPQKTQGFVQIGLVAASTVLSAELYAPAEEITDQPRGCCNANVLGSNVVFEAFQG